MYLALLIRVGVDFLELVSDRLLVMRAPKSLLIRVVLSLPSTFGSRDRDLFLVIWTFLFFSLFLSGCAATPRGSVCLCLVGDPAAHPRPVQALPRIRGRPTTYLCLLFFSYRRPVTLPPLSGEIL